MPTLSARVVRLSLVFLVVGAWLGAALLAAPALYPAATAPLLRLVPAHAELLLVGWLVPMAMGVAYWIFPRVGGERPASRLAESGSLGLVAGVVLAVTGAAAGRGDLTAVGRLSELLGAALFGAHLLVRLRLWRRLDRRRRAALDPPPAAPR